jgi:hypothetical protein
MGVAMKDEWAEECHDDDHAEGDAAKPRTRGSEKLSESTV